MWLRNIGLRKNKKPLFLSLCSGCGGMDLGLEKAGFKCVGQVDNMIYALRVLKKHWPNVPKHTDILTLLRSVSLVRIFQTQTRKEKVLKAKEVLSSLSVCGLSTSLTRLGYSLKMFPDSFQLTAEGTLRLSCKRFPKAGMGIRGEFWTVNTSESPNDAKECSLSDVLEENVHPKYYLSHKEVAGMIRRSKKWGRGGYVFLLEVGKDKIRRVKLLSLRELEDRIVHKLEIKEKSSITLSPQQSDKAKIQLSELHPEATLPLYGKTLILRKLTPTEKEKLQGLPKDWTIVEES